jgi:hypothetical protein
MVIFHQNTCRKLKGFFMINPEYVDGLELRIQELTAERDAALAQVEQSEAKYTRMYETHLFAMEMWRKESPAKLAGGESC